MIVGFTTFKIIKDKFNFNKYKEIEVIITHLHNDHAGALSQFILYMWFVYHKKVTIFCNCEKILEYLEITGAVKESYELKNSSEILEFIRTEHVKGIDSYGFRLQMKGKVIVYTGDTQTLQPFMPYIKNCDEFYVDVSKYGGVHLKFEDIIEDLNSIKQNNVKVFLMHIDDEEYIKRLNCNRFYID